MRRRHEITQQTACVYLGCGSAAESVGSTLAVKHIIHNMHYCYYYYYYYLCRLLHYYYYHYYYYC